MFDIKIESNIDEIIKKIDLVHKRHVPYVLKETLNDLRYKVRTELIEETQEHFTERSRWYIFKDIGIRLGPKATKSNLETNIFSESSWLMQHETGGEFDPKEGKVKPVPINVRTSTNIKIPRNRSAGSFLKRPRKTFTFKRRGQKFLVEKPGGKRKTKLRFLYTFTGRVRINKSISLYERANRVVQRDFEATFKKYFLRAIKG